MWTGFEARVASVGSSDGGCGVKDCGCASDPRGGFTFCHVVRGAYREERPSRTQCQGWPARPARSLGRVSPICGHHRCGSNTSLLFCQEAFDLCAPPRLRARCSHCRAAGAAAGQLESSARLSGRCASTLTFWLRVDWLPRNDALRCATRLAPSRGFAAQPSAVH